MGPFGESLPPTIEKPKDFKPGPFRKTTVDTHIFLAAALLRPLVGYNGGNDRPLIASSEALVT